MKRRIKLTESELHKIVKESVNMVLKENEDYGNTYYDEKLPDVILFLEKLTDKLDGRLPLLNVNGFEGGMRMNAVMCLKPCIEELKKMVGNLYTTDNIRPIDFERI